MTDKYFLDFSNDTQNNNEMYGIRLFTERKKKKFGTVDSSLSIQSTTTCKYLYNNN